MYTVQVYNVTFESILSYEIKYIRTFGKYEGTSGSSCTFVRKYNVLSKVLSKIDTFVLPYNDSCTYVATYYYKVGLYR